MKIAFFEIEDWEQTYLQQKLKGHKLLFFKDALSEKTVNLAKDAGIVSVFIYCKITDNVLSEFTHLQALVTRSTGYDHIDVASCKKRKIAVLNVPTYGENTVAEHTFSLLLSLSRKIPQSYERTRMGNFSLEGLRGFDLQGKTLGIIGMGHIGQHVARIARGFAGGSGAAGTASASAVFTGWAADLGGGTIALRQRSGIRLQGSDAARLRRGELPPYG